MTHTSMLNTLAALKFLWKDLFFLINIDILLVYGIQIRDYVDFWEFFLISDMKENQLNFISRA